ncbi:MAG: signal peptide peptidase SppA [Halieaceae bacterium]|nr:signal peptide peptidase SppA [Halieaceae bacterium]
MDLLKAIWRILSGISKAITVLVPLVFVGVFLVALSVGVSEGTPTPLPEKAGLLIAPSGTLVESRVPLEPLDALFANDLAGETLLATVIEGIDAAAEDDRITSIVLNLENLMGPSTSQAMEIIEALDRFSESGKPIVAVGDYFTQSQYLLASQADEIVLHPEGGVSLMGFGVYRTYLKQFLANIKVNFHVFRAGDNKSAVEPFMRDDMSPQERAVVGKWLDSLWGDYTAIVEAGRGKELGDVTRFVNDFPSRLESHGGDLAQTFLAEGYVDALLHGDEREAHILKIVDAMDADGELEVVGLKRYVADIREPIDSEMPLIAVVPIEGTLVPGNSSQGSAGSDTVVEQLERAVEDEAAAIVLRINSGGGSVFASEVIRSKVNAIAADGVPIVVSMGGAAASGGYWIAAAADEIWAMPTTITGSIGAFAVFPTIEGVFDYVGATVDGVGTTAMAGSFDPSRGLDKNSERIFQAVINGVYNDFLSLVSVSRDMTLAEVNALAGGKVWIGRDAKEIGLVDQLGGLDDAISSAAALAQLDAYETKRFGMPITPQQLILEEIGNSFGVSVPEPLGTAMAWLAPIHQPFVMMSQFKDPKHTYLQCFACNYAY